MRPAAIAVGLRRPSAGISQRIPGGGVGMTARPNTNMSLKQWTAVCTLDDIVPNSGVCALIGGQQVAVFRTDDDRVYALANHDPFSNANVLSRGIVGDIKGELVVASPVYKQHFSLATGQCIEDAAVKVISFAARVTKAMVEVEA
jgi:nitrite reductase (NADH) small subunit